MKELVTGSEHLEAKSGKWTIAPFTKLTYTNNMKANRTPSGHLLKIYAGVTNTLRESLLFTSLSLNFEYTLYFCSAWSDISSRSMTTLTPIFLTDSSRL